MGLPISSSKFVAMVSKMHALNTFKKVRSVLLILISMSTDYQYLKRCNVYVYCMCNAILLQTSQFYIFKTVHTNLEVLPVKQQ